MTLTSRKIAEMLKENTGTAMCDSGDYYGRHWQQNQNRKFHKEPEVELDFRYGIEFTVNLYHWMTANLEYDPEMQRKFSAFARRKDQQYNNWFVTMGDFVEHLRQKAVETGSKFGGFYGEGDPVVVNTKRAGSKQEETMAKYRVFIPEVHYQTVEIEAASPKEAVRMVLDGDGDHIDGELQYSHTLDGQHCYECFDVETEQTILVDLYQDE